MNRYICLVLLLSVTLLANISSARAGFLDSINPAVMGARAAATEMKEGAIKLNQPTGLFGAYWGMLERDFLKDFKQCSKVPGEEATYKEYKTIENTKVAVTYRFRQHKKSKTAGLGQIVLVPVIDYKSIEELQSAYALFREYIIKNIADLSEIEYVEDKNGNVTEFRSSAKFKYSSLEHFVALHQGRIVHVISFYR